MTTGEAKISLAVEELRRAEEKLKWSEVLQGEQYISSTELQADELSAQKAKLVLDLIRGSDVNISKRKSLTVGSYRK